LTEEGDLPMSNDTKPVPWPHLAPGLHIGRAACQQVLRQALTALAQSSTDVAPPSVRQITFIDHHFGEWPLGDDAVMSALSSWLRLGARQLRIVGVDFDATARLHPRFARWRRDWSHTIEVHQSADPLHKPPLRGLLIGGAFLQWMDAPDWRLRVLTDAVQVRAIAEQIADFLQRCEPGWPPTTIGL